MSEKSQAFLDALLWTFRTSHAPQKPQSNVPGSPPGLSAVKAFRFLKVGMNTVGKNLRLLTVSGIGGTCTGHADVKVDIAVRLAGVRIWMDLGCFPFNFPACFPQKFRCSSEAQIFFGLGDVWQFLSHQVAPEVHQLGRQRQGATGRRAVWILGAKFYEFDVTYLA